VSEDSVRFPRRGRAAVFSAIRPIAEKIAARPGSKQPRHPYKEFSDTLLPPKVRDGRTRDLPSSRGRSYDHTCSSYTPL